MSSLGHNNFQVCRLAGLGEGGFTLFETILVILILGMVGAGLLTMQSKLWSTQSTSRDQIVGQDLLRGCAERLIAVRRQLGYGNVTGTLCNGMGATGGFPADPSVALKDASGAPVSSCSSAICTVTASLSKNAGTVTILPLTIQFSSY